MKKIFVLLITICILLTGCGNNTNMKNIEKISTSEVKKISDNYSDKSKYIIIDVRGEDEYKEGHIKNAINVPLNVIDDVDISKDKKIIVYCKSGARSLQAATKLSDLGYEVFDMGGIIDWTYDLDE